MHLRLHSRLPWRHSPTTMIPKCTASLLLLLLILWSSTSAEPNRRSGRRNSKFSKNHPLANATEEETGKQNKRRGKLFSLFNVVTFKNDPCTTTVTTTTGNPRNGTCLTSSECGDRSGEANGNCAAGFGVCCLFIITTGTEQVTQNCSYIQNENFPNALPDDPAAITITVQKCSDDVCFLRLDFEMFDILGTGVATVNANEGDCMDMFTVTTPSMQTIPEICGSNMGQHIYVDLGGEAGGTAMLMFNFNAADANRVWDIKVTQVECDNPSAPADTCLQYMFGLTGTIRTFNFDNAAQNHLNNQQYSVCVRQEEGFCCVQYQVCQDEMNQLGVAAIDAPSGFSFDTTPAIALTAAAMVDDQCVSLANSIDYIAIPESGGQCNVNAAQTRAINSRYCGQFLNFVTGSKANAIICDCTAPFTVDIFFNSVSDKLGGAPNTLQSRGLCLEYMQVPC